MKNSSTKKKLVIDLFVIFLITCIVLTIVMVFGQNKIIGLVDGYPLLVRTAFIAFVQFSIAGLGVIVVMLLRKEKFSLYGLKKANAIKSLIAGAVLILIFLFKAYILEGPLNYLPFRQVNLTYDILSTGFPVNFLGMALVAIAWGFFESFNYVYISKKINDIVPIKNPFLRLGPIIMGISCIFVHGAVGQDMVAMLGSFLIIYGMLLIHEFTGNSWGCILVFLFYWNAY